jgi:hypothetical protein
MKKYSEQAENSIFFQQLDMCCQKVAEQIGEKPISEWTNSDYIRLSGLLSRKTTIHLSESTLKRIFGKSKISDRYYPQKATRDALAKFIGYRDWYEFEFKNPVSGPKTTVQEKPSTVNTAEVRKEESNKKLLYVIAFIILAAFIAIVALRRSDTDYLIQNVKLKCVNPEGLTPHSALFKLELKGPFPDTSLHFSVDFGDDRVKRINFVDSLFNHYYEVPGRYYPVLFYKNKPIDTGYVYLQSKGWIAITSIMYDTTRVYPVLTKDLALRKPIKVSAKEVYSAGVDTNRTFFVAFSNIKPTTISGDNFELSAHLASSENRAGVRCSQVDLFIYGEKDKHMFGIIKPECVAWAHYQFSENIKAGEKHDLRALGHDLTNGADVKLRIENKHVKLFINSKEAFKTQYNKSIGKIMGIKIAIAGIGYFDNLQITDLKTKETF